jgi:PAS domain S-box-containing protein
MLYTLSGVERSAFDKFPMPRATAVFHPTFVGEGVIRSDDILKDRRYGLSEPHRGMPKGHLPVRSYLAVPVISRSGEVLGGLFFGHPDPARFSDRHEQLMVGIAGQAAVALDNARLFQAVQRSNETLEQRVAEALAEKGLLADIIDGTDIFVQVVDTEYNWLAVNQAASAEFARIFGVPRPKAGDNMLGMLSHRPDDQAAVKAVWSRALGGEEFVEIEAFGDPDLDRRHYEMRFRSLVGADGQVIGAYQFVSDVTERLKEQARLQEAEAALRQAQKMEAIGQLTGGVAHDFNNLLTPIVGSLDMLQRRGVGSEREQRLIAGAVQSADRAKTLVQRLLAFARRQPLQASAVDVASLTRGMADLVASTTGPHIKVMVNAEDDLPPAQADPNQLEMAILNLAVNARDAMPEGGTLHISVEAETVGFGHRASLKPGRYLRLSVADTGSGMDEATMARAIEPFFSTKGVGKGTGLGLSMVHGLAAQLGGALAIQSRVGEGTNIEFWLPQSDAQPEPATIRPEAMQGSTRKGKALLVDDEDVVRLSTADMLTELGYEVTEAASAEEALELIDEGVLPELVVTDHLMPGMNGADLAKVIRAKLPEVPVLLVSGYAQGDEIAPDLPRLTKPFRSADLAASLAAIEN